MPPHPHAPTLNTVASTAADGLPPWPHTRRDFDDLSAGQRRTLIGGILLVHVVAAWGLMQVSAVREALQQAAPMFVKLIAPPSAELMPAPPAPQPQPVVRPKPLIAAAPSPVPAPSLMSAVPPEPVVASPESVTLSAPQVLAEPPPPKIIPASAVQYIEPPAVDYPRLSKRNGEAGLVIVRAFVDVSGGAPRQVQINQSSGHVRLDEAAAAAVKLARFKPYTENGQPVAGWALIPIHFELEK